MIEIRELLFHLRTESSSYLFCVNKSGHLEQVHYGARVETDDAEALSYRRTMPYGSQVMYEDGSDYCLDNVPLNWSGSGKGDFRQPPLEVVLPDGGFTTDFVYVKYEQVKGTVPLDGLPSACVGESEEVQSLVIELKEKVYPLRLQLIYTVFPESDVICRRAILINEGRKAVELRRFMSFLLDLPHRGYRMISLAGDWIDESARTERPVEPGLIVNQSVTGASSNRHNPGVILAAKGCGEDFGSAYGFNLVYSGNHYTAVERSSRDLVRVMAGINPLNFGWRLEAGGRFSSPEAVLSFSDRGLNGLSRNFHTFVLEHILRGPWQKKERPVLLNNWEAHFFDFTEKKLLKLARKAKELGVELFVLDDGWFGARDSDKAGLGDYRVNLRKLPSDLDGLSRSVHKMGLMFGLWFEPESVNPDSDLYRAHPEYAVAAPGRVPSLARNQLLLDLTRPDVRDYIVKEVSHILDTVEIDYVKWDMNRHMSEFFSAACVAGEFAHRYILGLYDILDRIFRPRPQILLESCSSGGNRFDLGMLCYSPQIWASDDTDPVERLRIQKGLSYFYPPVTMGAHVSLAPHQQTLRETPLSTRFNVAAFGAFGYELDPAELSLAEQDEIKRQIVFYKQYRRLFQFGRFYRSDMLKSNKEQWTCVDEEKALAVTLFAQTQARAGESNDGLSVKGLCPDRRYRLETVPQSISIRRFGHLIRHAMPVKIKAKSPLFSLIDNRYKLDDGMFAVSAGGRALESGVCLNNQFIGTGYHKDLRLWGDFGSQLYLLRAEDDITESGEEK